MRGRIEQALRAWDRIVDHRTGTAGDEATATWLSDQVLEAGATPSLQSFPFERRVLGRCGVRVGDQWIEGVPLFDGGIAEAIEGRLGVADGIALQPFAPFDGHPDTRALETLRHATGHAAIVAVANGSPVLPGLALLNAPHYGAPYGPPVIQVSTSHADVLNAAAAQKAIVTVHAPAEIETTQAHNVGATVAGRNPSLPPLVVMTPRSAWWTCTAERGGGIVVWLEAIRALSKAPPERTVHFTANTGHELGHVGLGAFLAQHPTLVADARAWVHLGANFAGLEGSVRLQASSTEELERLRQACLERGATWQDETPAGSPPLGEAANIHDGNGRYVSVLGAHRWFHHPDDRWPTTVEVDKTQRFTHALLDVIQDLAGR